MFVYPTLSIRSLSLRRTPELAFPLFCETERAEQTRLATRGTNLTHLGQMRPAPTASFGVEVYSSERTQAGQSALGGARRTLSREA
jgi:hypothetical protein